jgi:hypothetical protein
VRERRQTAIFLFFIFLKLYYICWAVQGEAEVWSVSRECQIHAWFAHALLTRLTSTSYDHKSDFKVSNRL